MLIAIERTRIVRSYGGQVSFETYNIPRWVTEGWKLHRRIEGTAIFKDLVQIQTKIVDFGIWTAWMRRAILQGRNDGDHATLKSKLDKLRLTVP